MSSKLPAAATLPRCLRLSVAALLPRLTGTRYAPKRENDAPRRARTAVCKFCWFAEPDGPRSLLLPSTQNGHTALHMAAQNGHDGCVSALIRAGADLEAKNDVSFTPQCSRHLKASCISTPRAGETAVCRTFKPSRSAAAQRLCDPCGSYEPIELSFRARFCRSPVELTLLCQHAPPPDCTRRL